MINPVYVYGVQRTLLRPSVFQYLTLTAESVVTYFRLHPPKHLPVLCSTMLEKVDSRDYSKAMATLSPWLH
jgi:hypothetical protein